MKQMEVATKPGISRFYLPMILPGKGGRKPELIELRSPGITILGLSLPQRRKWPEPLGECALIIMELPVLPGSVYLQHVASYQ